MIAAAYKSIWIIGCGNMGGAILQAWLDNGLSADKVTVIKPHQSPLPHGLKSQPDYPEGPSPDLILFAMKPHQLGAVSEKLASLVGSNSHIVSILAGTELEILQQAFPSAGKIVRLMPNMAVTVGKSPMIMVCDDDSADFRKKMDILFSPLGPPEWLENEDQMHIATALSGSGPAFVFRVIDALAVSAENLGLDKDQAARLALTMVGGAATLASASKYDSGTLANQVASPGGVTRKGLDVLDDDGRVNALFHDVLKAAMERNIEMAEEAKG